MSRLVRTPFPALIIWLTGGFGCVRMTVLVEPPRIRPAEHEQASIGCPETKSALMNQAMINRLSG
jgi:hypothetical protein